jgi:CubicO group peptidase (beta-lactamase class C family)
MLSRNLRIPGFLVGLGMISAAAGPGASAGVFPGATWPTASPAAVDLDPTRLADLAAHVGGSGVVIRHGYLVYEWGAGGTKTGDWASASKPLLSTLLFLADSRGLTTIHTPMADVMAEGSAKDEAITFFHLANMISGYSRGEEAGWAWAYNDYAINLYGYALCREVFGQNPSSVVATELDFLGFEDSPTISDAQYGRIKIMSIRDFARLGLLWLNRGTWNGTSRIPSSYFDLVTNQVPAGTPRTTANGPESWDLGTYGGTDDQGGYGPGHYGMNFWVNTSGMWPGVPTNVYAAIGHGGQKTCVVMPDLDLVACGLGSWGAPGDAHSTEALQLLVEANAALSVETSSWGRVKAAYREE